MTRKKSLQKVSITDGAILYKELRHEVVKAGILKRSYNFYAFTAAIVFGFFFFSIYKIYTSPISVILCFWCMVFAFFAVQVGGFMHDAGHKSIFKSKKYNNIIGHISAGLLALPFNSWNHNHDKHHAMPNVINEDPDLNRPLLCLTKEQYEKQKGIAKYLTRFQVFFYYPVGSFTLIVFQLSNIFYYKTIFKWKMIGEIIFFALGLFAWVALPFILFSLTKVLVVDVVVYLTAGFYMYNIFAPNHKGMPQLDITRKLSFVEHQIITSRNVNPNPITDFVYFGLNYQIEHHLFPNCPRNKLKLITPYVEEICRKMNLEFTRVGVIESNKIILSELNAIAKTA